MVQDEVTLVLATEVQVELTEGDQARFHYTTTNNVEAWTHWVDGLFHYRRAVTDEDSAATLACWKRALELDPSSAALNAMVALEHVTDARFGWWDDRKPHLQRRKAMGPERSNSIRGMPTPRDVRLRVPHGRATKPWPMCQSHPTSSWIGQCGGLCLFHSGVLGRVAARD